MSISRNHSRSIRAVCAALGLLLAGAFAVALRAQVPGDWGGWGGFGRMSQAGWAGGRYQREMVPSKREGFYGCWLAYDRVRFSGSKRGWDTDYPLAVRNFMTRVGDFTTAPINTYPDGAMADGVVLATDPGIYDCPFLFSSDAGSAIFSDDEVEHLRDYLLKGGFLWVDDFWGDAAMDHWLGQLRKIFPDRDPVQLDADSPVMTTFYFLDSVPQMPSIQSWMRSGGETFERRGTGDTSTATLTAILDDDGRIMVLMTHNTDIGDGMEREGVDPNYFYLFSPKAYALSVNIAIYSMTR